MRDYLRFPTGIAAACVGVALAAAPALAADDTITLGSAISLTGKYATNGLNTQRGYDLGIKRINEKGGVKIGGKTYKLAIKYYDDESTPLRTAELFERLIKQDGSRQPFDEEKLRAGMQRALEKRPVSVERLEEAIAHIKHKLRATGEREVKSRVLGELVMAELQKLDEVAYIRFASVYRRFQDLNEFREEIERLAREPSKD